MALMNILVAPDERLKQRAEPVKEVNNEIRKLMDDMLETMYKAPGIGLAAPQVGVLKRVIVIDLANPEEGEKPNPLMLANPEVIEESEDCGVYQEGCLSLPNFFEEVERPYAIKVRALNEKNEEIEFEADDLLATCIQHEIDHLDGTLFVDHISRLKRSRILTKLKKVKSQMQKHQQQNL